MSGIPNLEAIRDWCNDKFVLLSDYEALLARVEALENEVENNEGEETE